MDYYQELDDRMFEHERRPQGWAKCPDCEGNVYFHDHICAWKCSDCNEVWATSRLIETGTEITMP